MATPKTGILLALLGLCLACSDLSPSADALDKDSGTTQKSASKPSAATDAANPGADRQPEADSGYQLSKAARSKNGMVTTANPHATSAAQAILQRGGNAVDAAIAAQLVLGLVEPQSSGIGGGAFMLVWDGQTKALHSYDGRETAPALATPWLFTDAQKAPLGFFDAVIGGRSVGVPGVIKLLETTHAAHGKLDWSQMFEPAIELASNGFELSPRLHILLKLVPKTNVRPAIGAYLYAADGAPKKVGTLLRNPDYAATLAAIAAGGSAAFYEGAIATDILKAVNSDINPGSLSSVDLRDYRVKRRPQLCRPYREYRICSMGPPSSGGIALLQILGILEHFDMAQLSADSVTALHLYAEAARRAYADRSTYLADPDFIDVPTNGLLDAAYLKHRAAEISPDNATPTVLPGKVAALDFQRASSPELPSTSHFSVVDGNGLAVSMTSSIEMAFGSRLLTRGFLLNNQLTDFSFLPEDSKDQSLIANRVQGGKRPRSSMSPTMVFDKNDNLLLTIGSPGGSRIINFVAWSLVQVLDWKLPVDEAIAAPLLAQTDRGLELEEGRWAPQLLEQLQDLGHKPKSKRLNSGLHAIQVHNGTALLGAADPRREGVAAGL